MELNLSRRLFKILSKQDSDSELTVNDPLNETESDEDLPLECCFCAELSFDESFFAKHDCRRVEKPSGSHSCTFKNCSKIFRKSSELKKHQRIHLNIRNFKCSECPKDFVHQTSLKNHLLTHTKVKSFVCSICGLAFSTNGNLNQHKAKHNDVSERQYICDICDKRFTRASNLREHITTHTKEKNFQCSTCEKKFSSSSALAKHKKLHRGIKPFACPFPSCEKAFIQNSHLQKHLNSSIHSSSNTCEVCSVSFRRYETLLSHLKSHQPQPNAIILKNELLVSKSL